MGKFFVQKFVLSQPLSREKLLKRLLYKKFARKMLMKLTQGRWPIEEAKMDNACVVAYHAKTSYLISFQIGFPIILTLSNSFHLVTDSVRLNRLFQAANRNLLKPTIFKEFCLKFILI